LPFADELKVNIVGDASNLKGALDQSSIAVVKFADKIGSIGRSMAVVGLAVTAVSVGLIKMASDAEETASKFAVVFKDVSEEAAAAAKNLSENFGLSSVAAKTLLGDTGDLLTGFGFTGKAALDLSTQVNELAVDLASFTNYSGGAEGASQALTKALLGERESVKSLGISILEVDVKAKMLELTQQGLTFETERQAKAYATLLIAQEQSKNAIGDFARTSEGFANQMRILKGRVSDLGVALGEKLLPMATEMIKKAVLIVEKMTDWVKAHPKLVEWIGKLAFGLGVIAAVGGPILMAVGAFMKMKVGITAVTTALTLLNIKIGATAAVTTGSLIPALGGIAAGFAIPLAPIALLAAGIVGLYAAWKTNLFGMQDITKEAIANIKGNFTELKDSLAGGGGGAGAFSDSIDTLATSVGGFGDNIDDTKEKLNEFGQIIETFDEWVERLAEETKTRNEEIAASTQELADTLQPIYDRLYEMYHTEEEVAVRSLTAIKDAQIAAVEATKASADEKAAAITKITELYNAEVALIIAKIEEEKEAKRKEIETTVVGELAKMKAIREGMKPYDELIAKVNEVATATEESAARQIRALKTVKDAAGEITIESDFGIQSAGSYEEAQAIVAGNVESYAGPTPTLATGTPLVTKTGLAVIDKGEAVLTPEQNKAYQAGAKSYSPTVYITVQGDGDAAKIKQVVEQALNEAARQYNRRGFEMVPGIG